MDLTPWSDRLAFDVALLLEGSGETIVEVMERHHLTSAVLSKFKRDPVFLRTVSHYQTEVRDKGLTFRLKARAQAEELLTTSWLLVHDPVVPPAVKADLIKSTVKWGGLDPKETAPVSDAPPSVRITINLGAADPVRVFDAGVSLPAAARLSDAG